MPRVGFMTRNLQQPIYCELKIGIHRNGAATAAKVSRVRAPRLVLDILNRYALTGGQRYVTERAPATFSQRLFERGRHSIGRDDELAIKCDVTFDERTSTWKECIQLGSYFCESAIIL